MKKVVLSAVVFSFLAVSCGPSLCDCVELGTKPEAEVEESQKEACKEMMADMEKKYSEASDEEKEAMKEEVKACE